MERAHFSDWTDAHHDLIETRRLVYDPNRYMCSQLRIGSEGSDYGVCSFKLNEISLLFRVAKITPTKVGQFVTLWKRGNSGETEPYDLADPFDYIVVSVRCRETLGQFVFPKLALHERDVVSRDGKGGKRGMRIYPPWDIAPNDQARKTQRWQLMYFLAISHPDPVDRVRCDALYGQVE